MSDAKGTGQAPSSTTAADQVRHENNGTDRDWSWPCWDPEGGYNPYGWGEADQALFATVWGSDGDALVDELIETYGAMWVWMIPSTLLTRLPEIADGIYDLAKRRLINQHHTYSQMPDAVYENASMYGSFHATRKRRTWADAKPQNCVLCGEAFTAGQLNPWIIRQFGPARWCKECCIEARSGSYLPATPDTVRSAVAALAAFLGAVPAQNVASSPIPVDLESERRDGIVAALVRCPPPQVAREVLGAASWLEVLHEAGVITGAWRPSMGTYCLAEDRHPCRSLAEQTIDNWLTRHGIPHDIEPPWPRHPELNPSGRRRADWLLADGTYLEYAGLNDDKYLTKIREKRQLAAATGIHLVVISPGDMVNLTAILGEFIPDVEPANSGVL
ncbi:hypothetical protein BMF89_00165 [Arthrobacter sp. SRS-W-1-2016]|uniref:hypothetical protein n=1 Tax=Arthrobacter sp. SRS-W-1-2016 TaxID=1930254 RepID=UPI000990B9E3|nr:hypothetical protein [Arthrobacter sp. SRS-W-1-2016]OOP65300.1 hypothetical protein BMF89_00165 [Arthrobacter sp. SRS-W-1-2016]